MASFSDIVVYEILRGKLFRRKQKKCQFLERMSHSLPPIPRAESQVAESHIPSYVYTMMCTLLECSEVEMRRRFEVEWLSDLGSEPWRAYVTLCKIERLLASLPASTNRLLQKKDSHPHLGTSKVSFPTFQERAEHYGCFLLKDLSSCLSRVEDAITILSTFEAHPPHSQKASSKLTTLPAFPLPIRPPRPPVPLPLGKLAIPPTAQHSHPCSVPLQKCRLDTLCLQLVRDK